MSNAATFRYKASVIVLSYNQCDFILEALASVDAQDFSSLQLIVGDDASTDGTQELIEAYFKSSRFDGVKIFNSRNFGITKNINNCLLACEGEYIFLLGGDDLFLKGKISTQVAFMDANPDVCISFHDSYVFDSLTGRTLFRYGDLFPPISYNAESLIAYGTFFTGSASCIRNFSEMPKFNEGIDFASDWLWYIEVLLLSKGCIDKVEGVLSKYRRHSNNVTSAKNFRRAYDETAFTLNYLMRNYPHLQKIAVMSLGERQFAFFLKGVLAGHFRWASFLFLKSLINYPFSPILFLKMRIGSFFTRLKFK